MTISATEVPDLRLHFARQWEPDGFFTEGHVERIQRIRPDFVTAGKAASSSMGRFIRAAELFWVAPDFTPLLEHAAQSLPVDVKLEDVSMPPRAGLLVFGAKNPFPSWCPDEGIPASYCALSWGFTALRKWQNSEDQVGIQAEAYACMLGHWMNIRSSSWATGEDVRARSMDAADGGDATDRIERDRRLIAAFCYLRQQRLVGIERAPIDRSTARRSQRAGVPSEVRVVRLREIVRRNEGTDGPPIAVDWSHRWIVSGHWRNQPCGQGRAERTLTWISPYVKGPEDKPLVVKETVNALVR